MPGEDGEALRGRIDAWTDDLRPRSLIESYLVERAAQASWQLERAERVNVARLTTNIQHAEAGEAQPIKKEQDIAALGARLFQDRRGPVQLYPNLEHPISKAPRTSWSGVADDPDNPVRLVKQLESTLAGCGWMLDRWAELRARLEPGKSWQSPDKLKAIRLLGKQPLDAADDAEVAMIFIACHVIDPQHQSAFIELRADTDEWARKKFQNRLDKRALELSCPRNEIEGREVLSRIVERATARLEKKAEANRQRAQLDARLATDRLSFDDSSEGERLRRYETTCSRSLYKAIDSIVKMRLVVAKDSDGLIPAQIQNECVPIAAVEVDPDFQFGGNRAAESIDDPIVSTTPILTHPEINYPTEAADSDTQVPGKPMTTREHSFLRNEASTTRVHPFLRNEASTTRVHAALPIEEMTANRFRREERRKRRQAGRHRGHRR